MIKTYLKSTYSTFDANVFLANIEKFPTLKNRKKVENTIVNLLNSILNRGDKISLFVLLSIFKNTISEPLKNSDIGKRQTVCLQF